MPFVNVLSTDEIKPDQMKGITVNNIKVLVVNLKGKFYAIVNKCTHMGCLLSGGILDMENVEYPCNGSALNVKTGSVIRGPVAEPEPTFELKTEDNRILVKLEDLYCSVKQR